MSFALHAKTILGTGAGSNYLRVMKLFVTFLLLITCASDLSADEPVGGAGVLIEEFRGQDSLGLDTPSSLPDSVHYGKCLDLVELDDGNVIMMVGAPDDDDRGRVWPQGNSSGAVFVYRLDAATSTWIPFSEPNSPPDKPVDFKIYSPDPEPFEQFGWSLDLDLDSNGVCRAVIGAPGRSHDVYSDDLGQPRPDAGAAYVFRLDTENCWTLEQQLVLPMVDFDWSPSSTNDLCGGQGELVAVTPITDWPEKIPYNPFDPMADPDSLLNQLRIGVNAGENELVPVEPLSELFDAPNGAPMAQIVSVPDERFGSSVSIAGNTIAVGAPSRSVHLYDRYDGGLLVDCPAVGSVYPWVTDRDCRLWESGATLFDYRNVAGSCQRFLSFGTIGAPNIGATFLFRNSLSDNSNPSPWWLGGVDPESLKSEPQSSWEDPYFRGRILHDELGATQAWNAGFGSIVRLQRSPNSKDDETVDLLVGCPRSGFAATGKVFVYQDVWERPAHTRSDIAIEDGGASFSSGGNFGFDLDTSVIADEGYLVAIGQPGRNFSGYPGFGWNGTAHTVFVPFRSELIDDEGISTPIFDDQELPSDVFSFSIPRSPAPVQVVCDQDDGLIRIPGCTNCEGDDVVDFDQDGSFEDNATALCFTSGDPYNFEFGGFGMSVDLVDSGSKDEPVLLVGAPRSKYLETFAQQPDENSPPAPEGEMSGVLYTYELDTQLVAGIPAPLASIALKPQGVLRAAETPGQYELLGQYTRAISTPDGILAVSSQPRRSPESFTDFGFRVRPGSVATFKIDDDGDPTGDAVAQTITRPDLGSLADRSNFGQAIDIAEDILVISAPYATLPLSGEALSIYEEMAQFPPATAFPATSGIYGLFGASEQMGEVRVYSRNADCGGFGSGDWTLASVIRPPELNALAVDPTSRRLAPFNTPNMRFGEALDLSLKGRYLLVGAQRGGWRRPEDAIDGGTATGGAYLYDLSDPCLPQFLGMPGRYLNDFGQPHQGALGSGQGTSVAVGGGQGGFALVGAPTSSLGGTFAGYATLTPITAPNLSATDPIRLPPTQPGLPSVGVPVENTRNAFDLTGSAVDLSPRTGRTAAISSPNRRYFNADPAGPLYIPDTRGRVFGMTTSNLQITTLYPEVGMEAFGSALAMSAQRDLVAIGLDMDRASMPGMRDSQCFDFGGAVQVRKYDGTWSSSFASLPFMVQTDPTFCPEVNEFDVGSLECANDQSVPLLCDNPIGDTSNFFSAEYASSLEFSSNGSTLLIGDPGRKRPGLCPQSPNNDDFQGLFDVWNRTALDGTDLCDWERQGIGTIRSGRLGQRLGWDLAYDERQNLFLASAFSSTSEPISPTEPICEQVNWGSTSSVLIFSPNAKDCNGNGVSDLIELESGIEDCDGNGILDDCELAEDPELDTNLDQILDICQCLSDVTGDGVVDQSDVDAILQWIEDNQDDPTCFACPEDVNGDGLVDIADVVEINLNLGVCP